MTNAHPHQLLLEQLYRSFQQGDAAGMVACYHPEAEFEDPAFGKLRGPEVGAMWTMLLQRAGSGLDIQYGQLRAGDETGSAYWQARYRFSATGRMVHNKIHSSFVFAQGKIIRHRDRFDLWRWSAMALGWKGRLLGFLPFFRRGIQARSRAMLHKFMSRQQ